MIAYLLNTLNELIRHYTSFCYQEYVIFGGLSDTYNRKTTGATEFESLLLTAARQPSALEISCAIFSRIGLSGFRSDNRLSGLFSFS